MPTAWWQAVAGAPAVPPSLPFARMDEEEGILVDLHRTSIIDGKEVVEYRVQAYSSPSTPSAQGVPPARPSPALRCAQVAAHPHHFFGTVGLYTSWHRYTAFKAVHEQVAPRFGLGSFPVSRLPLFSNEQKTAKELQAFLRSCVGACTALNAALASLIRHPLSSPCVCTLPPDLQICFSRAPCDSGGKGGAGGRSGGAADLPLHAH